MDICGIDVDECVSDVFVPEFSLPIGGMEIRQAVRTLILICDVSGNGRLSHAGRLRRGRFS